MKLNRLALIVAGAAACALLQPAAAQTLYKSIMPDGRVVYGDKPAPGAAKVEQSQADTSKSGLGGSVTPREREAVQELERTRKQRESSRDKVQAAQQALKEAEAAREAGKEPYAGERIGTAGGSSRLTDAYFERQRRLEAAVEKARRDLEETR
jgi:hypothetical protein